VARPEWNNVRVLLLDIEGTTTPIDFVYKTLFPYASAHVESFLAARSGEAEIQSICHELKAENAKDTDAGLAPPEWRDDSRDEVSDCVAYVQWLMARDSKCAALKALQGKIWQQGFESGELHGEVYADVPSAFVRWRRQGREIAIYSSGSVLAQKLLFGSVPSGDLTQHIRNFFDTGVGIKTATTSYTRIAEAMEKSPREFLFLSDAEREVADAQSAGMFAALCAREAAGVERSPGTIASFDEVLRD
jgi:enolase-phosphatase E1